MPILSFRKRDLGVKINCRAIVADSKEKLTCAFLSVPLLLELTKSSFFDFWKPDSLVGSIAVVFLIKKGLDGGRGKYGEEE